ncbi:hypothetical protein F5B22DRAFT_600667 [Xylaria bambusicola]|uniref:uncharacterized protein n=1 Tax=Xylaria bambusicola TaxID=326684 RepID=UPI0020072647|nr:uncharacterized protein F5B22DRAFT_600667 [Xylaria bambusicola]KAI0518288.1 hypothetical protein F5B22DRAFT_600667 [Xylaria bambusicola]
MVAEWLFHFAFCVSVLWLYNNRSDPSSILSLRRRFLAFVIYFTLLSLPCPGLPSLQNTVILVFTTYTNEYTL